MKKLQLNLSVVDENGCPIAVLCRDKVGLDHIQAALSFAQAGWKIVLSVSEVDVSVRLDN